MADDVAQRLQREARGRKDKDEKGGHGQSEERKQSEKWLAQN